MSPTRRALFALLASTTAACSGVPEARVAEAPPPAATTAAADLETYALKAGDIAVEAEVSAGKSYTIAFPAAHGTLAISPSVPESSTFSLEVDLTSATSSWQVVADVARDRFLHTDRHPRSSLVSRSMKKGDDGLELWVDFTLHGTKKTLVMPARVELDACRARVSCSFSFSREAFGIIDAGNLEAFVSDTAIVRAVVDVKRKNAPQSCTKGVTR